MKKTGKLVGLSLLALIACGNGPLDEAELDLATAETVPEAELADQRGGFTWEGLDISFAAMVSTYLGDELVLQTVLNVEGGQAAISQASSPALTQVDMAQLTGGIFSNGSMSFRIGDANVYLANEGQTALIHRVDGALQNILINTASNISARQEVDATLTLGGYDAFRSNLIDARITSSTFGELGFATMLAGGH